MKNKNVCHSGGALGADSLWGKYALRNGHRQGLEKEEALELIYYNGFISGISCCGVD
jgi:hypothetical protein